MLRRLMSGILLLSMLAAMPAQATTYWDDGMEYATNDDWLAVWGPSSCAGNTGIIAITSSRAHGGSKSVKETFTGPPPNYEGGASCYVDGRQHPATTIVYTRFWMYTCGVNCIGDFKYASPTTKMFQQYGNALLAIWWVTENMTPTIAAGNWGAPSDVFSTANIPQQRWTCIETGTVLNTPGVANGQLFLWMDGVQYLNASGILFRQAGDNGTFFFNKLYTQNGQGEIYYDDWATGNTRIGCGGSADTTPPAVPTGLTIR